MPGRLVSSAKSWLSHAGRRPPRRDPALDRRRTTSPRSRRSTASAAYLAHLRDAWNHQIAGKTAADRLENQDVFLTVPASFDAVARELTVEAARAAGLEQVTLLEEPQAAFYAWLAAQGDALAEAGQGRRHPPRLRRRRRDDRLHPDRRDRRRAGDLALTRLAVGEHILLGGDNMDLALAYAVAATLPEGMEGLDAAQRVALGPRLPDRQGDPLRRPEEGRGPGGRPGPGLEGHRRLGQDRADPRDARRTSCSTASCPAARRPTCPRGAAGSA